MTTGQDQATPFYCPRCGGLMYKPTGSTFYWHANSNHPRCTITNIAEDVRQNPPDAELPAITPKKNLLR
ncbi:hypothetical protein [Tengunoibacter tsumagoiensis]|uniref:Uncharacterized protein n=1 Tax=Tengunoibacter tsumagoiensis TaxID=2014871 RepID=A0A402A2Q4_9CHLR|nr:hypothetical protein [Tengunoibacter tsumagoiensis]GCE13291.1 hypothetical protein KTT_31500 [Tengunoibacter tsumagoiensis]